MEPQEAVEADRALTEPESSDQPNTSAAPADPARPVEPAQSDDAPPAAPAASHEASRDESRDADQDGDIDGDKNVEQDDDRNGDQEHDDTDRPDDAAADDPLAALAGAMSSGRDSSNDGDDPFDDSTDDDDLSEALAGGTEAIEEPTPQHAAEPVETVGTATTADSQADLPADSEHASGDSDGDGADSADDVDLGLSDPQDQFDDADEQAGDGNGLDALASLAGLSDDDLAGDGDTDSDAGLVDSGAFQLDESDDDEGADATSVTKHADAGAADSPDDVEDFGDERSHDAGAEDAAAFLAADGLDSHHGDDVARASTSRSSRELAPGQAADMAATDVHVDPLEALQDDPAGEAAAETENANASGVDDGGMPMPLDDAGDDDALRGINAIGDDDASADDGLDRVDDDIRSDVTGAEASATAIGVAAGSSTSASSTDREAPGDDVDFDVPPVARPTRVRAHAPTPPVAVPLSQNPQNLVKAMPTSKPAGPPPAMLGLAVMAWVMRLIAIAVLLAAGDALLAGRAMEVPWPRFMQAGVGVVALAMAGVVLTLGELAAGLRRLIRGK